MGFEESFENFTSRERDFFQKACRRLLKTTFIVRDKDDESKRLYFFTSSNINTFSGYFEYIGFDVIIDKDNGVAMLTNCAAAGENGRIQSNRLQLKKGESIVLCCLWTIYTERIRQGTLAKHITINVTDLQFELEKYGARDQFDKKMMKEILNLFSKYNLIDVNGEIGEPDCVIQLYASLQFALSTDEFSVFVKNTVARMNEKSIGNVEKEDFNDEADE